MESADRAQAIEAAPAQAAPAAVAVPDGWKLVPVDLTPEMKREFMDLLMDGIDIYVNRRDQIEIQTDAPRRIWKAVLALSPAAPKAQADARDAGITWPKARDVGRIGDMSPAAHIRVGFDSDNDVFVSVWDENGGGSIEFCNPGGGGGGQSSRTRMALVALMVAIEADNAEKPSRDWWAQGATQVAQQGGAA
ncbi:MULTISPECIES: hypothetical protein [Comamonas]|uniref:hypothetical protein n=1 Tax=Comamonas TaxID=283 RepID=UPI0001DA6D25|nr:MULTISPECIES: hypothetical protein [Comamonas]EFI61304.1 hypothetical protein CTS44_12634 [Comamonas thiooxydans]TFF62636.1 hypothetical protein EIC84_00720 [Comamonas sp. A23]UBQ43375.1 hypothetical protein LCH15_07865 [Comamonas thiooxydans]